MNVEQAEMLMRRNTNFKVYEDKGVAVTKELQESGFSNIKIWEQPMNVFYRDGEDYMSKFAEPELKNFCESQGLMEKFTTIRAETVAHYDQISKDTLKSFAIACIYAEKN